jgi:hypothetical protein
MKKNNHYLSASVCCFVFFFASCGPRSNSEVTAENADTTLATNSEKFDSLNSNVPTISLKEHPDTSLNGLALLNWSSIENTVKQGIQLIEDDKDDYSYCVITNVSRSESVKMLRYPGSSKNEFAKFILTKNDKAKTANSIQLGIVNIETSNGTKLDTKIADFMLKHGLSEGDFTTEGLFKVFTNKIDDFETNGFLKRFNMPSYQAKYYFENNVLIKIEIGFDYP